VESSPVGGLTWNRPVTRAPGRRWDDALAPVEEAVGLYRTLAKAEPAAYQDYLARSLANLSACLSQLGRPDEARTVAEEAMTIRRPSDEASPAARQSDFADAMRGAVAEGIDVLETVTKQFPDQTGDDAR
jgi:tetratricopeptide (TPR) repeat protein